MALEAYGRQTHLVRRNAQVGFGDITTVSQAVFEGLDILPDRGCYAALSTDQMAETLQYQRQCGVAHSALPLADR